MAGQECFLHLYKMAINAKTIEQGVINKNTGGVI
jgi:hypothetical protein